MNLKIFYYVLSLVELFTIIFIGNNNLYNVLYILTKKLIGQDF